MTLLLPGMHKVSKKIGATSNFKVPEEMLSKVHTEDTQILGATTKNYSFHSSLVPGFSAVLPGTMNTPQITWD
jgi:hypothetical protein